MNADDREALQKCAERLQDWKNKLPMQAKSLHDILNNLTRNIQRELNGSLLGVFQKKTKNIQDIINLTNDMAPVVKDVISLINWSEQTRKTVVQLKSRVAEINLNLLVESIEGWNAKLGTLCVHCTNQQLAEEDKTIWNDIIRRIQDTDRALSLFEEVSNLSRRQEGTNEVFYQLFDALNRQTFNDKQSVESLIHSLQNQVKSWRNAADNQQNTPELRNASQILAELGKWLTYMKNDPGTATHEELFKWNQTFLTLKRAIGNLARSNAVIDDVRTFLDDARRLQQILTSKSLENRKKCLLELEEWQASLTYIGVCQPNQERPLLALKNLCDSISLSHEHAQWMERVLAEQSKFRNLAHSQQNDLERNIDNQTEYLCTQKNQIYTLPMVQADRDQLERLVYDIEHMPRHEGNIDKILFNLKSTEQLKQRMKRLEEKIQQQFQDVKEKVQLFVKQFDVFTQSCSSVSYPVPPLPIAFADLQELELHLDLNVIIGKIQAAESWVTQQEHLFIENCKKQFQELLDHAQKMLLHITTMQLLTTTHQLPEFPKTRSLPIIIQALRAIETINKHLNNELSGHIAQLMTRIHGIEEQIATYLLGETGPSNKQKLQELQYSITLALQDNTNSSFQQLEMFSSIIANFAEFKNSFMAQEEYCIQQYMELKKHFDECRNESILNHCSKELVNQLEGLLYGLSKPNITMKNKIQQLEKVSTMLGQLELHGRRIAAKLTIQSLQTLESYLNVAPNSPFKREIENLIDSVNHCGNQRLLPVSMRKQLILTSQKCPKP